MKNIDINTVRFHEENSIGHSCAECGAKHIDDYMMLGHGHDVFFLCLACSLSYACEILNTIGAKFILN